ncbi:uncharacterized protein EV154DRAFT_427058 [Mucor mucedo]|uniref:uncharacterized protein n=1 Tax=Mucor mucedo TaxID=29922 RepID=UPI00222020E7|nr:uncharacterized protein EV154DRAFT_427058 [Mucor mucedo]KAI7887656.1 hypothetical protein EV154DRAFT_427058 [Mucor mucedo]
MAIRMATELGIHEDLEDDDNDNPNAQKLITQETRRRLFWTIFTIDKFSSAATGRPSILQEKFCTAYLPANVDTCNNERYYTETLDGSRYIMLNLDGMLQSQLLGTQVSTPNTLSRKPSLGCFSYLIRATNLLGKVTAYVNLKGKEDKNALPPCHPESEFSKLDRLIEDWYEQLPLHLKNTPANFEVYKDCANPATNRQFILLHILHNTLRVLLHRPSLVVADALDNDLVQPEIKRFVLESVEKCMTAVDNVTVLLKEIGTHMELMPPFLTYLAYTVATVVVSASFSSRIDEAQKAKQALGVYFQLLLAARNYWAMADKLYFMVRDLYAIHSNVVVKRSQEPSETQEKERQMYQQVLQPEQVLQQQFQQQIQQQHLQIQQFNQVEMPNHPMSAWSLPFYDSTLIHGAAAFDFEPASGEEMSANIFQLPEGYDQPLMFPSRDVNSNGM